MLTVRSWLPKCFAREGSGSYIGRTGTRRIPSTGSHTRSRALNPSSSPYLTLPSRTASYPMHPPPHWPQRPYETTEILISSRIIGTIVDTLLYNRGFTTNFTISLVDIQAVIRLLPFLLFIVRKVWSIFFMSYIIKFHIFINLFILMIEVDGIWIMNR